MNATTYTRPTTTLTGIIEEGTNPAGRARWNVATINQAGYLHPAGGYSTKDAAQRHLNTLLDDAEAAALRENAVNASLDDQDARCDQCGTVTNGARCHSCNIDG